MRNFDETNLTEAVLERVGQAASPASTSAKITTANGSILCERVSPPCGLARHEPVVVTACTQRIAVAADTPKRSAAARRDKLPDTAATTRVRKSWESG